MNKLITIGLIYFSMVSFLSGQDLNGSWYGKFNVEESELKVVFHLSDSLGYWQGTMDSPNTGAYNVLMDTTYTISDSIFMVAENLNTAFSGSVDLSAQKLTGDFKLYGKNYPILFTRDSFPIFNLDRPQDPQSVDYYVENVVFPNYKDSILLAGTITMPFDPDIKKAVVLLNGSGPHNRNYEIRGIDHRPYLVLSDYLTRNGIAVFRYDDRGVGLSGGNYYTATTEDFAEDAMAAVDYLHSRIDLQDAQVGVIGHDEGGIVASMLGDSVDFNVLLGMPGIKISDLMLAQSYLSNRSQGLSDTLAGIHFRMYAQVYNYIKQSKELPSDSLSKNIQILLKRGIDKYPEEIKNAIQDIDEFVERQASVLTTPWYRYYLSIDPQAFLSKLTNPVLGIIGTLDKEIPYQSNLAGIEAGLQKAGNTQYEIFGFNGVNHFFQAALTGSPQEYSLITETFNEEVMSAITEWINKLD